jgi:hypothetical protein
VAGAGILHQAAVPSRVWGGVHTFTSQREFPGRTVRRGGWKGTAYTVDEILVAGSTQIFWKANFTAEFAILCENKMSKALATSSCHSSGSLTGAIQMTNFSHNTTELQPEVAAMTAARSAPAFPPTHHPRCYKYCEVAVIFGRSPRTIRHWVKTGLLKAIRVGAARLISEAEITRVITSDAPSEALDDNFTASTDQREKHQ